jgi:DNA-binding MarR family transcriptional regulator
MSLSRVKKDILEKLWEDSVPLQAADLSRRLNLKYQVVLMNISELEKMGYVESKQKGYYSITEPGREALGLPLLTAELAQKIVSPVPVERAFHFFTGIGNYTGVSATSLQDFCEKIKTIDKRSVRFHFSRGDFEKWFEFLGDKELAKRTSLLKKKEMSDEQFKDALYNLVKNRCSEIKIILTSKQA